MLVLLIQDLGKRPIRDMTMRNVSIVIVMGLFVAFFGLQSRVAFALEADTVEINNVEKTYYIKDLCAIEDAVETCPGPEEKRGKDGDVENPYEDLDVYTGDRIKLPLRASLPYPESRLELASGGML